MSTPQEKVAAALAGLGITPPSGWDALNLDPAAPANAEARGRAALERYERAKIIADGVDDEALAMIEALTLDAKTFDVVELGLINGIGFGIWREGQNALVRWIREQKRIAAQGPGGDIPSRKRTRKR